MTTKFLPVHAKMRPAIKNGMQVIHNGGGSRQGWLGKVISTIGGEITISFNYSGKNQKYTWDWFLSNFYISCYDIGKMSGVFNGKGYYDKYRLFVLTHNALKQKQRNLHKDNKALADAKDNNYTSTVGDKNLDPLDDIGTYMVLDNDGKWHGTYKTQRLAEAAASSLVKKNNKLFRIVKHVADIKPRVIVEADVERK
ncbi:hypothetical protein RJ80_gp11 [Vibrio phage phi-A318]|uniref:Uncharacterized protein n=2 Tax=Kaohsiungvirus TaxID=2731674 RepID=A0A067YIV1_9CAUD|nr:hypothetical protein RJ80_gp11 [Vibrio phage phi-A318]YP_009783878.1 hypothetical protein HOQ87_gp10 [Vibrio phage AS51]AGZ17784.1 hypothetical protein [Vibrio phage phi-A318]AHC94054.1 hypothetical protein [Vibrio phage AS51]